MRAARPAAVVMTALLALAVAGLARIPYTPRGSDAAVLRLSWRLAAPAREACRRRTPAELEALPVHMRTPDVCEVEVARYSLVTQVGEAPADTVALAGGGVKGDRPLFVLEEWPLGPGRHRIRVELWREAGRSEGERVAALDTVLRLARGRVALVTMDPGERRLRVVGR